MRRNDGHNIREVAREAGVSPATVSRVMNGTAKVSEAKSQKVLETVRRLGYTPSPFFGHSAVEGNPMIGVLVPDFGGAFYWPILENLMSTLEQTNYQPLLGLGSWNKDRETEVLQYFKTQNARAVVVLGSVSNNETFETLDVPVLVLGGSPLNNIFALNTSNARASYEATKYLLDRNHQAIVHITSSNAGSDMLERAKGYTQAMKEAKLEPRILEGNLLASDGMRLGAELFSRWPDTTAVFSADDLMAFGILSYAQNLGIDVPGTLSVIGFDDMWMSNYTLPPLTTVRQPVEDIGLSLGRAIMDILEQRTPDLTPYKLNLIERASVSYRR